MEPVIANPVPANIINIAVNSTNINWLINKCNHQYKNYHNIDLIKIDTFTQGDLLSCVEFQKGWLYSVVDNKDFLKMIETAKVVSILINQRLAHLKKCAEVINREAFQAFEKDDFQKLQDKEGNMRKYSEQTIKSYLHSLGISKNIEDNCSDMVLELSDWAQNSTFFIGCFSKELRKDIIKEMADPTVESVHNSVFHYAWHRL